MLLMPAAKKSPLDKKLLKCKFWKKYTWQKNAREEYICTLPPWRVGRSELEGPGGPMNPLSSWSLVPAKWHVDEETEFYILFNFNEFKFKSHMMTRACSSGQNSPTASRATPSVSDLQSSPPQAHPRPASHTLVTTLTCLAFWKSQQNWRACGNWQECWQRMRKAEWGGRTKKGLKKNTGNCRHLRIRREMLGNSNSFINELKSYGNSSD